MSDRTFRWTLFLAALAIVPLPLFGVETALIPTGRMILLAGVATLVTAIAGGGGVGPTIAGLFWAQALFWSAVCWAFGWGFARLLVAARPGFRQRIAFVLVAIVGGIAFLDPIYTTPYSATSARSTLTQVYR